MCTTASWSYPLETDSFHRNLFSETDHTSTMGWLVKVTVGLHYEMTIATFRVCVIACHKKVTYRSAIISAFHSYCKKKAFLMK